MNTERFPSRLSALILGFAALALTGWAAADPPTRVARLGIHQRRRKLFAGRRR